MLLSHSHTYFVSWLKYIRSRILYGIGNQDLPVAFQKRQGFGPISQKSCCPAYPIAAIPFNSDPKHSVSLFHMSHTKISRAWDIGFPQHISPPPLFANITITSILAQKKISQPPEKIMDEMRRSTHFTNDLDHANGYLPGITANADNLEAAPYTRPYTGTSAILERDGWIPSSIYGRDAYPGSTPYNTPEPDSGLPAKFNRHIGNLSDQEIAMRIGTINAALALTEPQETSLQAKLRSCRRDWELLLNDNADVRQPVVTASSIGDMTAEIELQKTTIQQERAKLIVDLINKERNTLPYAIYQTLKPTME